MTGNEIDAWNRHMMQLTTDGDVFEIHDRVAELDRYDAASWTPDMKEIHDTVQKSPIWQAIPKRTHVDDEANYHSKYAQKADASMASTVDIARKVLADMREKKVSDVIINEFAERVMVGESDKRNMEYIYDTIPAQHKAMYASLETNDAQKNELRAEQMNKAVEAELKANPNAGDSYIIKAAGVTKGLWNALDPKFFTPFKLGKAAWWVAVEGRLSIYMLSLFIRFVMAALCAWMSGSNTFWTALSNVAGNWSKSLIKSLSVLTIGIGLWQGLMIMLFMTAWQFYLIPLLVGSYMHYGSSYFVRVSLELFRKFRGVAALYNFICTAIDLGHFIYNAVYNTSGQLCDVVFHEFLTDAAEKAKQPLAWALCVLCRVIGFVLGKDAKLLCTSAVVAVGFVGSGGRPPWVKPEDMPSPQSVEDTVVTMAQIVKTDPFDFAASLPGWGAISAWFAETIKNGFFNPNNPTTWEGFYKAVASNLTNIVDPCGPFDFALMPTNVPGPPVDIHNVIQQSVPPPLNWDAIASKIRVAPPLTITSAILEAQNIV